MSQVSRCRNGVHSITFFPTVCMSAIAHPYFPGACIGTFCVFFWSAQIKVADQTRVLEHVKIQHDDTTIRVSARVDKLWQAGFRWKEANLQEPCRPVLVYKQGSEVNAVPGGALRGVQYYSVAIHCVLPEFPKQTCS